MISYSLARQEYMNEAISDVANSVYGYEMAKLEAEGNICEFDAHDQAVTSLAFHPSGSFLLTGSDDTKLKVWDLQEGRLFYTLHGHEGPVNACAFSPAGDFFSSCATDSQAMVWRTNFDQLASPEISYPRSVGQGGRKVAETAQKFFTATTSTIDRPTTVSEVRKVSAGTAQPCVGRESDAGGVELAGTLEQVVGQLDILAQTVALLEQRLSLSEDRNVRMEHLLKGAIEG